MILSQEAQSSFNDADLRGKTLPASTFDARFVNCVPQGQTVEAFVVSPVDQITGYGYDNALPKASYATFGVYAVDSETLAQWKKSNLGSPLSTAFNYETSGASNILMTRQEAMAQANAINGMIHEEYMSDAQSGKLAGITNWKDTASAIERKKDNARAMTA